MKQTYQYNGETVFSKEMMFYRIIVFHDSFRDFIFIKHIMVTFLHLYLRSYLLQLQEFQRLFDRPLTLRKTLNDEYFVTCQEQYCVT